MTKNQKRVLAEIRRGGPRPASDLAEALGLHKGSVVQAVASLEKAGLLERVGKGYAGLRVKEQRPDFGQLVDVLKKTKDFESVCDALEMSPSALRAHIAAAEQSGLAIQLDNSGVRLGAPEREGVQETQVEPTVGSWYKIGVVSDLHLGSKYCLRPQIVDLVGRMYAVGVRDILIPGDLLDGCYRHGEFELVYSGIEDQTQDLYRTLPQLDGLRYHFITGNHDFTFTEKTGVDVGKYIAAGRSDLISYGDRAATLAIGGTTVRMLHPSGGAAYAMSYNLQKFIEAFGSGDKPGIFLVGHYHKSCYINARGVHAMLCPTMQGPGSAFGKSLGKGPMAIGGLLLKWRLTRHATIRDFNYRQISYFKREMVHDVQNP
jgi:DNA-binding Lrp family transcriptional regulator